MKNSTKFLMLEAHRTTKWFFVVVLFIVASTIFVGCTKNNIPISNEETSSEHALNSYERISVDDCGCSEYLIAGQDIPSFASVEAFRSAYDCLSQCHGDWLDEIERNFPNITSEEFDDLVEEGIVNEWEVFDNFSNDGNYSSLFRKDLAEEDEWLENGGAEEDAPNEILPDEVLKSMINADCKIKIGREIVDVCNTVTVSRDLEWCTPYGGETKFFYSSDGDYRVKLGGGLVYIPVVGSFVYGKITAYKKNSRGGFNRHRENLNIRATCDVRKSPLNDCELLTPVPTGWKSNKTKSLTVTEWNLWNTQIWYKKTFASTTPNTDGLAEGYSDNVSLNLKGF